MYFLKNIINISLNLIKTFFTQNLTHFGHSYYYLRREKTSKDKNKYPNLTKKKHKKNSL